MIIKVHPDEHGIVRDVTVGMRPRDSRDKTLPYKFKKLDELTTTVQRLMKLDVEEEKIEEDVKTEVNINKSDDYPMEQAEEYLMHTGVADIEELG